jgi:hypothetical protein
MKQLVHVTVVFVLLGLITLTVEANPPEEHSTKMSSITDLLQFASPKYNRAALKIRSEEYGIRFPSQYIFQENHRLKNAIETLNKTQDEAEKQEQWKTIVEEFHNNTLVPDAISILERLPEEEQLRFLTACLQNGGIIDKRHRFRMGYRSGIGWGRNGENWWLDRGLCGIGIIKRMRYDLLKTFLLRRDFEHAVKLIEEQSLSPYNAANTIFSEFYVALPISIFKDHPEIKDLNDYYRFLDASGDRITSFCAVFDSDQRKKLFLDGWWIP